METRGAALKKMGTVFNNTIPLKANSMIVQSLHSIDSLDISWLRNSRALEWFYKLIGEA